MGRQQARQSKKMSSKSDRLAVSKLQKEVHDIYGLLQALLVLVLVTPS